MKLYSCVPNDAHLLDELTINFDDVSCWRIDKGDVYTKVIINIKGIEYVLYEIKQEYKKIYCTNFFYLYFD